MRRESSSSQNRKAGHTLTHRTTAIPSLLACGGEGNKEMQSLDVLLVSTGSDCLLLIG